MYLIWLIPPLGGREHLKFEHPQGALDMAGTPNGASMHSV